MEAREAWVPVDGAQLFCRDVGAGEPIVVLHGGPEFDHAYFLPELDRLADSFRLIYYDQRGRGRSARGVRPADVTLSSDVEDIDGVRGHFGLESVAVLGHSWGGALAMEYAIRQPTRVSHVILMDTVPASPDGWQALREHLTRGRAPADREAMAAIAATDAYGSGDLAAEAEYLRHHFRMTVRRPEHLEALVARLRSNFSEESVLLARAIDQRLFDETARSASWDLFPALRQLDVPTLVLHGEQDFIPVAVAAGIADAVPGARLSVLSGCGHFTYLEAPERVHDEIARFFGGSD
jgi:proline iminopeptidase